MNGIEAKKSHIKLPHFYFLRFSSIILFEHVEKEISFYQQKNEVQKLLQDKRGSSAKIHELNLCDVQSNFSDLEYCEAVEKVRQMILNGKFCEANLTRKFFGSVREELGGFVCYKDIVSKNKVPYGAYLKLKDTQIISFSPERFLKLEGNKVSSRPIKGTMPSGLSISENKKISDKLRSCPKNRSENLMIVDLMRNDFAKICIPGTVKVPDLFETNIYKNVIHLYSSVTGVIKREKTALDLVESSFPPGSMTGAPKIEVMSRCNEIEGYSRGLYSGAIGYYHPDESDFSVVIRTLILQNSKFEFQVGGAIVSDSVPKLELEEIYAKAKPFAKYLKM